MPKSRCWTYPPTPGYSTRAERREGKRARGVNELERVVKKNKLEHIEQEPSQFDKAVAVSQKFSFPLFLGVITGLIMANAVPELYETIFKTELMSPEVRPFDHKVLDRCIDTCIDVCVDMCMLERWIWRSSSTTSLCASILVWPCKTFVWLCCQAEQ